MSRHDDTVYIRHMLDHARTAVELASARVLYGNHISPIRRAAQDIMASIYKAYASASARELCRDDAAQRSYEETI